MVLNALTIAAYIPSGHNVADSGTGRDPRENRKDEEEGEGLPVPMVSLPKEKPICGYQV